jgi:hypothetical protein
MKKMNYRRSRAERRNLKNMARPTGLARIAPKQSSGLRPVVATLLRPKRFAFCRTRSDPEGNSYVEARP